MVGDTIHEFLLFSENKSALGAVSGRERTQYGRVVKTGASEKGEEDLKRSEQRDHTR